MTNANLPGTWLFDRRMEELSDRAWRIFTGALMWSAQQETDGRIPRRSLRMLHPDPITDEVLDELTRAGLIEVSAEALAIRNWSRTQTTAEQLQAYRDRNRKKQANYRARQQGSEPRSDAPATDRPNSAPDVRRSEVVTGSVTGHVTGNETGGVDRQTDRQTDKEGSVVEFDEEPPMPLPPLPPIDLVEQYELRASLHSVDFAAVKERLTEQAGDDVSDASTWAVIKRVLERSKPRPGNRTGLVLTSVRRDWADLSRLVFVDEAQTA